MSKRFTKAQLRAALDTTDAGLADFFGITRAAVAQWDDDAPIPELRQLQLERKRPDLASDSEEETPPHRITAEEGESPAEASTDELTSRAA